MHLTRAEIKKLEDRAPRGARPAAAVRVEPPGALE